MNNTLKHSLILTGYKLLFSLLSFAFITSFYYIPLNVFSSVTAALYLIASYSYIWKIGKTDSKNEKLSFKNVLYPVLISEFITLIITLFEILLPNDITITVFRLYQLVYAGFIVNNISKFVIILPIFIIGFIAYYLGFKKIEIYDGFIMKLVYKDKNKK